jgi:uncharacterized protein (DUF1778 family)
MKISRRTRPMFMAVRLSPKDRYLAEIAARIQHRTLSNFIENYFAENLPKLLTPRQIDSWDRMLTRTVRRALGRRASR